MTNPLSRSVRELDALHIVRDRVELGRAFTDQRRRGKEELGRGIDESGNQPWARNAINFGMLARYPSHKTPIPSIKLTIADV